MTLKGESGTRGVSLAARQWTELERSVPNIGVSRSRVTPYSLTVDIYWHTMELIACRMDKQADQDNPIPDHLLDTSQMLDDKYDSILNIIQYLTGRRGGLEFMGGLQNSCQKQPTASSLSGREGFPVMGSLSSALISFTLCSFMLMSVSLFRFYGARSMGIIMDDSIHFSL